jgi:mono/diheme cytochrome c family protein
MRTLGAFLAGMAALALLLTAIGVIYVRGTGLDARAAPSTVESRVARRLRALAVSDEARQRRNPVALTPGVLEEGLAHFADHCASCHGNDGSGQTELGRGLYPKAPDMRLPGTQSLSDGELFSIIEHGVRFTGMPSWSTGTSAGETASWQLVHVIRHLPMLTPAELERMQQLNPRSPDEVRQEIEEEHFLNGDAR